MSLSNATLLRVSTAYRDGYRAGEECNNTTPKYHILGFDSYDFKEGFRAGLNDAFWNKFHIINGTHGIAYKTAQKWTDVQKRIYLTTPQVPQRIN